jgi:hypothetical protein
MAIKKMTKAGGGSKVKPKVKKKVKRSNKKPDTSLTENEVRKELRKWASEWGQSKAWRSLPLTWVEAAAGGTFGCADVFVPCGYRLVPIELKVGKWNKHGDLETEIRPAQKRWHVLHSRAFIPTLFLIGVGASPKTAEYFLVRGEHALLPHFPRRMLIEFKGAGLFDLLEGGRLWHDYP